MTSACLGSETGGTTRTGRRLGAPLMSAVATAICLAAICLTAGCATDVAREEAALRAQFTPLQTRAQFVRAAAGQLWRSEEILVRFSGDGTLAGEIDGVAVTGTWAWQGDLFCSSFRVADAGGAGCAEVGIRAAGAVPQDELPMGAPPRDRPAALLIVPRDGTGAPMVWEAA